MAKGKKKPKPKPKPKPVKKGTLYALAFCVLALGLGGCLLGCTSSVKGRGAIGLEVDVTKGMKIGLFHESEPPEEETFYRIVFPSLEEWIFSKAKKAEEPKPVETKPADEKPVEPAPNP